MGVQVDITKALSAAINTIAGSIPVVWFNQVPNPTFSTSIGRYYHVYKIPISTMRITVGVGGINHYQGICQINVCEPNTTGIKSIETEADRIVAAIPVGTRLTSGSSTLEVFRVEQAGTLSDAIWVKLPISIYYRVVSLS